ncbi:MAG: hypothetical protein ACRDP9_14630 [Kribbellaceae bacterium]
MTDETRAVEEAQRRFIAAATALYAAHAGLADLNESETAGLRLPDNYRQLLREFHKASNQYADALETGGHAVPAGLRQPRL